MTDENLQPLGLNTGAHKIIAIQALLVTGMGWVFYTYQGLQAAQAAFYGGGIAIFNVWLSHRGVQTAAKIAQVAPTKEIYVFYFVAVQRFIFALGCFILGMGWLEWPPIPMIVTFGIAQIGYFFKGN